jgi:hypothetical protein
VTYHRLPHQRLPIRVGLEHPPLHRHGDIASEETTIIAVTSSRHTKQHLLPALSGPDVISNTLHAISLVDAAAGELEVGIVGERRGGDTIIGVTPCRDFMPRPSGAIMNGGLSSHCYLLLAKGPA